MEFDSWEEAGKWLHEQFPTVKFSKIKLMADPDFENVALVSKMDEILEECSEEIQKKIEHELVFPNLTVCSNCLKAFNNNGTPADICYECNERGKDGGG